MDTGTTKERKKHDGRNVKRIREIIGMKQETLAAGLGVNQQRMSAIEQKEEVDDELMRRISEVLNVPVEAIRNFDEEATINIISNTFQDFKDHAVASALNYQCTFNPVDKLIEALKKNEELYEKLLQSEREKVELLQNMLKEKSSD